MTNEVIKLNIEVCKKSKRYKPIEIIGQGTYGIVMKCKDKQTNEVVAIKKIMDSYFQMPEVLREFTILRKLNTHIHVIHFLNVFRTKSSLYIVFPYMDYNMHDYISEYYPSGLGYDLTKEFMIQIIRGIDFIHGKYVVHRDIKPDNILLTKNGIVKICDMGVSKMLCSPLFNAELLMTPQMGTLWYQAPEMLLGIQIYGTEIDVWSLGIIFIECMIGNPIITQETSINQYLSIVNYFGVSIADQKYVNEKVKSSSPSISSIVSIEYINVNKFPNVNEALRIYYPSWPIDFIEIVSKCLQFKPSKRKTTKSLLHEPYFVNGIFLKTFKNKLKMK